MIALAYSRLPYWRWFRHAKKRAANRPGAAVKPWNGFVLIALLVVIDLTLKSILTTPEWGWHHQPASWFVNPIIATLALSPLLLFSSTARVAAFGIAAAIGNGASALTGAVPNPFVLNYEGQNVAFNLADAYLVVGAVMAVLTVLTFLTSRLPRRHP